MDVRKLRSREEILRCAAGRYRPGTGTGIGRRSPCKEPKREENPAHSAAASLAEADLVAHRHALAGRLRNTRVTIPGRNVRRRMTDNHVRMGMRSLQPRRLRSARRILINSHQDLLFSASHSSIRRRLMSPQAKPPIRLSGPVCPPIQFTTRWITTDRKSVV